MHQQYIILSDTQVEVFFSRGKQKVFMKHLHPFGSDYSKMHTWDVSIVQFSIQFKKSLFVKWLAAKGWIAHFVTFKDIQNKLLKIDTYKQNCKVHVTNQ